MHAWDTILEGRDLLSWQHGRHSLKFGGSFRCFIWPMWGFFQNRGYYQFTNGYTTQTATNDGTGSALASFLLGLPAVKQRQAGIPQMQLRQWYADGFVQDSFRLTRNTTVEMGLALRVHEPADRHPLHQHQSHVSERRTLCFHRRAASVIPKGLMYSNKLNFAPRFGISQSIPSSGWCFTARLACSIRRWT